MRPSVPLLLLLALSSGFGEPGSKRNQFLDSADFLQPFESLVQTLQSAPCLHKAGDSELNCEAPSSRREGSLRQKAAGPPHEGEGEKGGRVGGPLDTAQPPPPSLQSKSPAELAAAMELLRAKLRGAPGSAGSKKQNAEAELTASQIWRALGQAPEPDQLQWDGSASEREEESWDEGYDAAFDDDFNDDLDVDAHGSEPLSMGELWGVQDEDIFARSLGLATPGDGRLLFERAAQNLSLERTPTLMGPSYLSPHVDEVENFFHRVGVRSSASSFSFCADARPLIASYATHLSASNASSPDECLALCDNDFDCLGVLWRSRAADCLFITAALQHLTHAAGSQLYLRGVVKCDLVPVDHQPLAMCVPQAFQRPLDLSPLELADVIGEDNPFLEVFLYNLQLSATRSKLMALESSIEDDGVTVHVVRDFVLEDCLGGMVPDSKVSEMIREGRLLIIRATSHVPRTGLLSLAPYNLRHDLVLTDRLKTATVQEHLDALNSGRRPVLPVGVDADFVAGRFFSRAKVVMIDELYHSLLSPVSQLQHSRIAYMLHTFRKAVNVSKILHDKHGFHIISFVSRGSISENLRIWKSEAPFVIVQVFLLLLLPSSCSSR
jgi:hypothetical protein